MVILKVQDIDTKRNMIHIKRAKGGKDRYTLLPDVALQTLREYWGKEKHKKWLFPAGIEKSS